MSPKTATAALQITPDRPANRQRSRPLTRGARAGLWTGALASAPMVLAICATCATPSAALTARGVQGSGATVLFAVAVVSSVVGLQLRRVASSTHNRQSLGGALIAPLLTLLLAIATLAAVHGLAELVLSAVGTAPATGPTLLP